MVFDTLRRAKHSRLAKWSLVGASCLLSLELGVAIIVGYFAARVVSGRRQYERGLLPSLNFRIMRYRVHLHHWFLGSGIAGSAWLLHADTARPALFYGFLVGLIAQGIMQYDDWAHIIKRA